MFPIPLGFHQYLTQAADPDANAFIVAAGISNPVQANAINELVIQLKAKSLWTVFDVIYPFVGGTAAAHKLNLKDPLDEDASFRLNFIGSWTHDSMGATIASQSTSNRADTFYSPADNLTSTTNSQVVYYTQKAFTLGVIGCTDEDTSPVSYFYNGIGGAGSRDEEIAGPGDFTDGAFIVATRTSNSSFKYKIAYDANAFADYGSNTGTGGTLPDVNYFLGCTLVKQSGTSTPSFSDGGTYGFVALGDGLGDSASNTLSIIVNAYQTSLSRNFI
jgi:hypothetical protein